ncbi:hypothetical protein RM530_05040 [Algiphilus sp. W345]|uniref:Uncharacterized protein n=1 Tax=Banduia mediterranea TaxID=3075609 RepID=A0ABU2WFT3_9GAMM|nr:hypothetical protein [Algiphilus sp. W345]MDT0496728.1 hypothetical protein [Algiphilus sp. W345]
MSTSQGSANWSGDLKSGSGSISTLSGALKEARIPSPNASKAKPASTRNN